MRSHAEAWGKALLQSCATSSRKQATLSAEPDAVSFAGDIARMLTRVASDHVVVVTASGDDHPSSLANVVQALVRGASKAIAANMCPNDHVERALVLFHYLLNSAVGLCVPSFHTMASAATHHTVCAVAGC